MSAKKDKEADEKTIAKARMNFGIVHGVCNIINYITMGANLLFLYKMTAVWRNLILYLLFLTEENVIKFPTVKKTML